MEKYNISVFFPVYKDEVTIPKLVTTIIPILKSITKDYEIILVEDGCPGSSAKVVDELAKKYKNVRAIHHKNNIGYGGALKSGIYNSTKELIFYTDGDAQYDVKEIKKLLPLIDDTDVVIGYKIKRSDSLYRLILGYMYQYGARFLFNIKIRDVDCDFRLFRKKIFKDIKLHSNNGAICIEMMKKIQQRGFKIKQVPVHHYPRLDGTSSFFSFRKVADTLTTFVKLWIKFMIWQEYE
jgi:glycosyltransferase involved in cell wall biosynthesis